MNKRNILCTRVHLCTLSILSLVRFAQSIVHSKQKQTLMLYCIRVSNSTLSYAKIAAYSQSHRQRK